MAVEEKSPPETRSKAEASPPPTNEMLIVDFGSKTRKQIARLLKGQGALADDIMDTIDELKRTGDISPESQKPVVVIVKERQPSRVRVW
jgi:hypothetical protein